MSDEGRLLKALLREDLGAFVHKSFKTLEPGTTYRPNWHIDALCYHLGRVARGECRRLIINVPPRSMKSICVSVAFPAWVLGHKPTTKLMCVSYGRELVRKQALDFRTIVDQPWYHDLFADLGMDRKRQRDTEITTAANGYRFASALGGGVLGRGADIIILDDPIKPQDAASDKLRRRTNDLYDNAIYTRLNEKTKGAIIIVMQRLHEDDLVGHVLEKEDWEVVAIPAIETEDRAYRVGPSRNDVYFRHAGEVLHAEREPQEVLDLLRCNLGSLGFAAQYQQQPLPLEGNYLKRQWMRYYDTAPSAFDLVVASWDTASTDTATSDYSVCTVWGMAQQELYLIDVIRQRLEVPDLRRLIEATHQQWRAAATLIEDTDVGRAIGQELRRSSRVVRPLMWRPKYEKEARFLAQSPKFESGQVLLPREAPWLASYINELLAFPNGRHDDQVDSTAQALDWLTARLAQPMPAVRPSHVRRPIAPVRPTRRYTPPHDQLLHD